MSTQQDAPWGEGKQQHEKISGYRQLTPREIDDMNRIKALGQELGQLLDCLDENEDYDKRWLEIGRTELQKGLMATTRAVARPTNF